MNTNGRRSKELVVSGVLGAIVVEVLFFCIGSLGALGLSPFHLFGYFLLGSAIPVLIGMSAGACVFRFVEHGNGTIAFALGVLSMLVGTSVLIGLMDYISGFSVETRIILVVIIPIGVALLLQWVVVGGLSLYWNRKRKK